MRELLETVQEFVERLDPRAQRLLLIGCTAALVLFAGTTVTAARAGDVAETMAGAVMLAGVAAVCAVVWSVRRAAVKAAPRRR